MFNSTVLEVAIGLCFTFASISLIASSLNEALASALKLRANTLLDGVKAILNDHEFDGLARDIYNNALVNPRSPGDAKTQAELVFRPSYIEPRHFATALIESIQYASDKFEELGKNIDAIGNRQLRNLLRGVYDRANGRADIMQAELANWFNNGMDRVSGAYKRRTQLTCFIIALILAVTLNVDAIHLFTTLWRHPALVAALPANVSGAGTTQVLIDLKVLPIGWDAPPVWDPTLIRRVFGWLITASSALFGAPFWFDTLQKITNLRGAGAKTASEKPGACNIRQKKAALLCGPFLSCVLAGSFSLILLPLFLHLLHHLLHLLCLLRRKVRRNSIGIYQHAVDFHVARLHVRTAGADIAGGNRGVEIALAIERRRAVAGQLHAVLAVEVTSDHPVRAYRAVALLAHRIELEA
jgi:hypothetical protein